MKCSSCPTCNQTCKDFEKERCKRLDKAPYVCNGCEKKINHCTIAHKYLYNGRAADRKYRELLTSSRSGINMTQRQLHQKGQIISPLIEQGQSPYQILTNHPELNMSVRSMYTYIHKGLFSVRNIDLKRQAKFKPRKCHKTQITDRSVFFSRTYYCIRLVTILYSTEKICYTPSKTVLEDAVMPRYIVTLTNDEIQELKAISYRIKHAQILLKLDQKPENKAWTYDRIKDAYGAARSTIAGIAQRFVMGGMEAALGRKVQENRRRKVTGDVEARICAIACSEPPEGASRWTMQAIADELIRLEVVDYITDSTVCEVMKKTKSSRGS